MMMHILLQITLFEKDVIQNFEKMKSNIIQIRILSAMRDTLLPKLMGGEVII